MKNKTLTKSEQRIESLYNIAITEWNKLSKPEKHKLYLARTRNERRDYQKAYHDKTYKANEDYREKTKLRQRKNKAELRAKNPDVLRDRNYKYLYGISLDIYNNMLKKQNYGCWICERSSPTRRLAVDHRHVPNYKKLPPDLKRKEVRGLLCTYHNRLIGRIEHSKDCRKTLEKINAYFAEFKMKGEE